MFIAALLAIALVQAIIRYFTFSFRIEGNDIITQQGILERTERHIPLDRVQEVRLEQGILHRLLRVTNVHVETAGGKGPEASLSVLSTEEAERLRTAVFERSRVTGARVGTAQQTAQPGYVELRRLAARDLVMAGLTSNHLVSAMVLVGAIWAFLDDVLPENIYERIAARVYSEVNRVMHEGAQTAVLLTAVALLAVFVVGTVFSIIGSLILFHRFTLSQRGEDLHRSYGLFTQRSSSLPRRRIQVLEIEEGFLRRLFGLATIRADTAGTRSEDGQERRGGRDVIMPILPRPGVDSLLPRFFPDMDPDAEWQRVSRKAVARGTIKGTLLCLILGVGLYFEGAGAGALWTIALAPAVYLVNLMRYHNLGYMLTERYFRTRRGWLSRSTHIVPIRNAQVVEVRQTLLDRRLGLATLLVDTAGQAYTGGGPRITNLPEQEARMLAGEVSRRAAMVRYRL
jgi:putative membrane protein